MKDGIQSGAVISPDKLYRYLLWRRWADSGPVATWIMLNPSTADAKQDDATIRRCVGFARQWGCVGVEVANLYAYRSTDPKILRNGWNNPIGPDNDAYITEVAKGLIVAAWGSQKGIPCFDARIRRVQQLLRGHTVFCLGTCADGNPRHPVRLAADTPLEIFWS